MYRVKSTSAFLLLMIVSLFLSGQTRVSAETVVEKYGKLSVKGTHLVGENGEVAVLRGVSFGWHNWWSDYYNRNAIDILVDDWHATLLRAAIGVGPEGSYLDNRELAMRCVSTVVEAAIEKGVYVIIDWHSHDIYTTEAKAFFAEMATRYKDYPNVIYEIYNEPDHETWQEVKAYSTEVIRTIRAIDPDNIIIVGSPHWDQDVHIVADDPITGFNNLVYSLHFYAATHKKELRDRADYALSKGLPLFVSECAGMEASGDGPINTDSWNTWVQWMNANQISWAAWSVFGKDESCSMLTTITNPYGKWTDKDLKEWAHIVKNRLTIDNKIRF